MGTTKKLVFHDDVYAIADIFKALGHPARLQILKILLDKKRCTCGTIVDELPLAQSTVSKHLLELKKVNLVSLKIQGKKTIYSLIEDNLMFTKDFLLNYISLNTTESVTAPKSSKKINTKLKTQNYIFKDKLKN
jgi:ArsR family transcriptional regulator